MALVIQGVLPVLEVLLPVFPPFTFVILKKIALMAAMKRDVVSTFLAAYGYVRLLYAV